MTDLVATRRSLHGVAELLLAGPQHERSGTIRLAPRPGGFGTVAAPDVEVAGGVLSHDGRSVALDGLTAAEAGAAVGLQPASLDHVYRDGSGIGPRDRLVVTDEAAAVLAAAFDRGAAALRSFRPDAEPVLWPEHFDLGITVDRVNFGVSPGDDFLAVPYAYVGPWDAFSGPFWNAPFGAARPLIEIADLSEWFAEGAAVGAHL